MGTGEFTAGGNPVMDRLASHPRGVEILLVASCYTNRDKLRPDEPLGSYYLPFSTPSCSLGVKRKNREDIIATSPQIWIRVIKDDATQFTMPTILEPPS